MVLLTCRKVTFWNNKVAYDKNKYITIYDRNVILTDLPQTPDKLYDMTIIRATIDGDFLYSQIAETCKNFIYTN